LGDDSPVCALLDKNVGSDHLCFETTDLNGALIPGENHGCFFVSGPVPAAAFGGRRIAWIYSPDRQLFELLEAKTSSEVSELNGDPVGFP
jgi:methylmalonyl-CoA/ethylmalonyl-CoA epimerase